MNESLTMSVGYEVLVEKFGKDRVDLYIHVLNHLEKMPFIWMILKRAILYENDFK